MNFINRNDLCDLINKADNTIMPLWVHEESSAYSKRTYSWTEVTRNTKSEERLFIKIGGHVNNKNKTKNKKISDNRVKSTKYSILTFLPQNLLEQFKRIANFYFLIVAICALLIDTPVSPVTSLIPLLLVVSLTAAKQGYEDYLRYKADNMVNFSPVTVIRNGFEEDICCMDIVEGDLVLLSRECDLPCDIVLLKTTDPKGICFVTTANLDGESNLKMLRVPKGTPNIDVSELHTLGVIECETPKTDLYSFNGKIKIDHRAIQREQPNCYDIPLTADNLLLRGSRIKNTEWIIGCAVYTGQRTKLALNSRLTRTKKASSEDYVNKFLIFILILMLTITLYSCLSQRENDILNISKNTYLGSKDSSYSLTESFRAFLSYLVLYNYLIPISLYVTIEMNKFLGSFFIEWDSLLYESASNQACIVNTSDLNEELGQVNILFSDKTGTLTKNEMYLQQLSIKGQTFLYNGTNIQDTLTRRFIKLHQFNENQMNFFIALALCHSIQVAGKFQQEREDLSKDPEKVKSVHTYVAEEEVLQITSMSMEMQNSEGCISSQSDIRIEKRIHPPPDFSNKYQSSSGSKFLVQALHEHDEVFLKILEPVPLLFSRDSSLTLLSPTTQGKREQQSHRRTQSYAPPPESFNIGERKSIKRSASTLRRFKSSLTSNSRESYAAPAYMKSTISKHESIARRSRLKSVVNSLDYQGSSPDEKSLIEACATLGIVYAGEKNNPATIRLTSTSHNNSSGELIKCREIGYKRLEILEFTSERKRMSVIVQDKRDNSIWLFTKGADNYVLPLCTKTIPDLLVISKRHLNDFAKLGLRTLVVARKRLSENELNQFQDELQSAKSSLSNRKHLIEECYAKLETDLEILGATAVEDALQDNVEETLKSLSEAGIKLWVLTGDKVETALSIANSCGHISDSAEKYFIVECRNKEDVLHHLNALDYEITVASEKTFALLIDGTSLRIMLKECPLKFRDISLRCQSVLCCRLSPLQKCEVVQLIKTSPEGLITAAIGDGANDVSMIQEAHLGLGLVGKEGRQAARCADYAFAKFSMIKRLFLVHGHYSSHRLSVLVLYFFYKSLVFTTMQFYFQISDLISGQSLYDSFFLTLYNIFYTSIPILVLSLTEKIHPEFILIRYPELYKLNTNNRNLHWKYFFGWIVLGFYHSIVIYGFNYVLCKNSGMMSLKSESVDLSSFGISIIHNVVFVVNLCLWLKAKYQTFIFIASICFSLLFFCVTTVIYNIIPMEFNRNLYWTYNYLLSSLSFWLLSIIIVVTALLPEFIVLLYSRSTMLNPIIRIIRKRKMEADRHYFGYNRRVKVQESTEL